MMEIITDRSFQLALIILFILFTFGALVAPKDKEVTLIAAANLFLGFFVISLFVSQP